MLKAGLVNKVSGILEENDYITCRYNGCFDIGAKKEALMFLKVLENVDSIQTDSAKNLQILSRNLSASIFLIGEHTRTEKLKNGIVYERFGLPTVCFQTFESLIEYSIFPSFYRDRGGVYVEIDRELLKRTRKKKQLSQRELAEAVGISRKSIYEHESRNLRMFLNIAKRIESVLEKKISKDIDVLSSEYNIRGKPENNMEKQIGSDLGKLGFETDFIKKSPLDIFAKEKALIISDIETNKRKLMKRAFELKNFISFVKKPGIIISEKTKQDYIDGIPVIERKDLKELDSSKELLKIARTGR